MNVSLYISTRDPLGTEKIELNDVSSFEFKDTEIVINFNGSPQQVISLVNSQEIAAGEWLNATMVATRVGLNVDFSNKEET